MYSVLLFSGFLLVTSCLPHQFYFVKEPKSWTEAQSFCRHTYTDLATVEKMEDMILLLKSSNGSYNGSAWIGLYDDLKNSWRWSLEEPQFYREGQTDYRNWVSTLSEVVKTEPVCVSIIDGNWHLYPCDLPAFSVCFDGRKNATESFVLISEQKNWTEAQRYCRQHYTDLASIRNSQENQRITSIVGPYLAWIGLFRTRIWSDQSNSSFRFWKTEDPFVNMKHLPASCTAVSFADSGRWTEESCNILLPVICYTALTGSPHQYYFVKEPKSWTEAQSFCRHTYTDLATVEKTEDMIRLLKSSNGSYNGSAWIGLYDDLKNSWRWSLEEPQFYREGQTDYRRWFDYPLNENGNNFCTLMIFRTPPAYEGKWIDSSCAEEHQFICYDDVSDVTGAYVPVADPKNWTDAQSYCREHYVDLVSVRNQEENLKIFSETPESILSTFLNGVWGAWIGLHRTRTWSDDSKSSFTYWRAGEPDNGKNSVYEDLDQHCTAMSFSDDGHWTDENCLTSLPFICYSLNSTAEPPINTEPPPAGNSTVTSSLTQSDIQSPVSDPPAVNSTVKTSQISETESNPSVTPSLTSANRYTPTGDGRVTAGLIGLRVKLSVQQNLSQSEIEKLVLIKLEEEIYRLSFSQNFVLRVRRSQKITSR